MLVRTATPIVAAGLGMAMADWGAPWPGATLFFFFLRRCQSTDLSYQRTDSC